MVLDYIQTRPDHLWSQPPKHEEPFSSPRAWHMVSDALREYGDGVTDAQLEAVAFGCLTPHHAGQFKAFTKQLRGQFTLKGLLDGKIGWPSDPADRDVLYFIAHSFRAHLIKHLPDGRPTGGSAQQLAHRAKGLIKQLAAISHEIAQMVVAEDEGEVLPAWFLIEVVRDLPRLMGKRDGK
jgi:hypothetical protein